MSQGVASSGLSELIVAIGRSQDPQSLSEKLVPHLDALLKIVQPTERIVEGTRTLHTVCIHEHDYDVSELFVNSGYIWYQLLSLL